MSELIDEKILPESLMNYRHNFLVTWDIETLETKVNRKKTVCLNVDAHQYIASIGVATNLPGRADKWFCRSVSSRVVYRDKRYFSHPIQKMFTSC